MSELSQAEIDHRAVVVNRSLHDRGMDDLQVDQWWLEKSRLLADLTPLQAWLWGHIDAVEKWALRTKPIRVVTLTSRETADGRWKLKFDDQANWTVVDDATQEVAEDWVADALDRGLSTVKVYVTRYPRGLQARADGTGAGRGETSIT